MGRQVAGLNSSVTTGYTYFFPFPTYRIIEHQFIPDFNTCLPPPPVGLCTVPTDRYGRTIDGQVTGTGSPVRSPSVQSCHIHGQPIDREQA
jgi:hypothetical protein